LRNQQTPKISYRNVGHTEVASIRLHSASWERILVKLCWWLKHTWHWRALSLCSWPFQTLCFLLCI